MVLNLSKEDCLVILGVLCSDMIDCEKVMYYGGDVADNAKIVYKKLLNVYSKINYIISVADVEANSQDAAAVLPKRTASDLDQREAGDEVSLDQHIQLYKEVF